MRSPPGVSSVLGSHKMVPQYNLLIAIDQDSVSLFQSGERQAANRFCERVNISVLTILCQLLIL